MNQASGLVRKLHRRGKRRRDRLRLIMRVVVSVALLATAAGLSAGVIHVVERPLPPLKALADTMPGDIVDPTMPVQPLHPDADQ